MVVHTKLIVSDRKLPLEIESIGHLDKKPFLTSSYGVALYNILKDIREFSNKREMELERNSHLCCCPLLFRISSQISNKLISLLNVTCQILLFKNWLKIFYPFYG